jgi:zinc transporter ZupT
MTAVAVPSTAVALVALVSAAAAVWFVSSPRLGRLLVPFGAGLLGGMALFGVWPELVELRGGLVGALWLAAAVALLGMIHRYIHPVCPACSGTHDHSACAVSLHGFAAPLVVAAVLHSFMDGLAVGAAWEGDGGRLAWGVPLAVAVHKIPEGLAYGSILRAAVRSRWAAIAWCAVTQAPTVAGALVEALASESFGHGWLAYPLALAGGSFLFLAYHAIQAEWKQRGAGRAFGPALTGLAGAAVLQQGLRALMR